MSDSPQGLDLDALAGWLDRAVPGLVDGPLEARLITGGKSNLTYAVHGGSADLVVRRPPLGHVLATAHDMAREHRVMDALAPTDVPVPRTYGLCEDVDVIGAPFYVMQRIDGTPYARASDLAALGAERTRAIADRMVDTLATLHAVDPASVGLQDFGRPEGYLERQVRRWTKQLDASRSREVAGIDELASRLAASVPADRPGTIVHGDYRLDNLLVDDSDTVTAVLDWEMSTLGDPLTDLAVLLAYQELATAAGGGAGAAMVTDAARAPGFPSSDEVVQRYATASGRDVGTLDFHLGLAYFKLAVILEGIHFRHSHGQTLGSGFDGIGDLIEPLVAYGLASLGRTA